MRFVVLSKDDPDKLIAARKSSPLVVGVGDNEFFLASDATPIIEYTEKVVYLNDEEVAVVHRNGDFTIRTLENEEKTPFNPGARIETGAIRERRLRAFYAQRNL